MISRGTNSLGVLRNIININIEINIEFFAEFSC